MKAFCNWLVRDGRLVRNPLAYLQRLNTETDIRRERRVLAPDELDRLITAAGMSKWKVAGFAGRDRAMLYRVAAFTGLRAQELASLTAHSFDLDANPPTVRVEACYSKHRRTDVLPLEADLVRCLREHLAGCNGQLLWPGQWFRKAARMLRKDLAAARKAWVEEVPAGQERDERDTSDYLLDKDRDGRVADFHSLRHGFITYLVTANVPPKVAQTLARHSTITLTLDRYTHLGVVDLVEASTGKQVWESTKVTDLQYGASIHMTAGRRSSEEPTTRTATRWFEYRDEFFGTGGQRNPGLQRTSGGFR
jgi:integrase